MTARSTINDILNPRSIAIVGASDTPWRIGGKPLDLMLNQGFQGQIYPINPNRDTVQGVPAYPSLDAVPGDLDFVLIAVPAAQVLDTLRAAAAKNARTAMIFSSGFAEAGPEGAALQDEMTRIARDSGLRIIGPNCLGSFNLWARFYPSFSTTIELAPPTPGSYAIVSQSGACGTHIYVEAAQRRLGVGYLVTTGNEADIHVAEAIAMLVEEDSVEVILAYAEDIKDGPMLIAALQAARAARKPVIFLKAGRSAVGASAVASHTAALAGEDAVYDAVLRQYGAWRADSIQEMIDIAAAARPRVYPAGNRIGLISISGGAGIVMADAADAAGLDVAEVAPDIQHDLKQLMPFCSPRNPVDVSAQALNQMDVLPDLVRIMLDQGAYDALVGFWSMGPSHPARGAMLREALQHSIVGRDPKVLFAQSFYATPEIHADFEAAGLPAYDDMNRAVRAVGAMMHFGQSFAATPEPKPAPEGFAPLPDGPLGEREAKAVLAAAGLPVVQDQLVQDRDSAAAAAPPGQAVAMKVASPDIVHKSDIGGVVLGVDGPKAAAGAFDRIMANARANAPDARIDGVLISPMISGGVECILGGRVDPIFGPMVLFGLGGIFTEVLHDTVLRHAPFGPQTARAMIDGLKGAALLKGARGGAPADLDALAGTIARFSQFVAARAADLESVEINPLLARPDGCVALDAVIQRPDGQG